MENILFLCTFVLWSSNIEKIVKICENISFPSYDNDYYIAKNINFRNEGITYNIITFYAQ